MHLLNEAGVHSSLKIIHTGNSSLRCVSPNFWQTVNQSLFETPEVHYKLSNNYIDVNQIVNFEKSSNFETKCEFCTILSPFGVVSLVLSLNKLIKMR